MTYSSCEKCGREDVPQNEIFKVEEIPFCTTCFEQEFPTKKHLKGKEVRVDPDSTICAFCNKDNSSIPFDTIGSMPCCTDCKEIVKNRPYPVWVKAMFGFALALVFFSSIWNYKYYKAYQEFSNFVNSEDFEEAISSLNVAYSIVPESEDLKANWSYYESVRLFEADSLEQAYDILKPYEFYFPEDFEVDYLLTHAAIGMAFESKNYGLFLDLALDNLEFNDKSAFSYLNVASAYAANHASQQGEVDNDSFADSSKLYIEKALSIGGDEYEMQEYINRIEYRLYSQEVIDSDEFYTRYPNGWNK